MVKESKDTLFTFADAVKPLSPDLDDEKAPLLRNDIEFSGSYAHAVEIPNGRDPPTYESINPQTIPIPRPLSPPSTTLISIYSEPIQIEYEENERILHQAGCGRLLWNYYACCGMFWTIIGCFCCVLPLLLALFVIFYIIFAK